MYLSIYINSRGTRGAQSDSFSTVFLLARGRAPEAAQGSIFLPKWVPKSLQNRFRTPLRGHWKRELDFTSIEAGFSSLQRSYESPKPIKN